MLTTINEIQANINSFYIETRHNYIETLDDIQLFLWDLYISYENDYDVTYDDKIIRKLEKELEGRDIKNAYINYRHPLSNIFFKCSIGITKLIELSEKESLVQDLEILKNWFVFQAQLMEKKLTYATSHQSHSQAEPEHSHTEDH